MGNQAKFPTSNTPGKQRARGFQKVPDTTPRDLDAYNQYMLDRQRRMDYDASMEARQQRMDAQAQQQRTAASGKGITMGAGYANRPFG